MPPVTLEMIQEAVTDIKSGLATKAEAIDVINRKMKEDEEKAKAMQTSMQTMVEEMKTANNLLAEQIKNLVKTRFAAIRDSSGHYKGMWDSMEQAKNFGLFVLGYALNQASAKKSFTNSGIEVKAFGDGTNVGGDVVIPQEFYPRLIDMIGVYGVYRRNAGIWPMASDSGSAPKLTGDPEVYCPGAGVAPTAGTLTFGGVGLQAQKWMTYIAIPRESAEDMAIALGEVVGRSIARAFAKKEDLCGFNGEATATYFNIVGLIKALLNVNATTSKICGLRIQATAGTWAAIVADDILALPGLIADDADDGIDCKWYTHKNFFSTVMVKLALGLGGTSAQEAIHTAFTRNPLYQGRPVEFTRVMHRVKYSADHIPVLLANLRTGAILGERRQFEIAQDISVLFTSDQIAIRGTERIAMNNHGVGTSTDASDGGEAGHIVGLLADIA